MIAIRQLFPSLLCVLACQQSDGDNQTSGGGKADGIGDGEVIAFDFGDGDDHGFRAIFRDLPEEIHAEYLRRKSEGLDLGPVAPLPGPLVDIEADTTHWMLHDGIFPLPDGLGGTGLLVQSTNRSDDIDMYIVKELGPADGIAPNTTYEVTFLGLSLAGDAPVGAVGVGGAPDLGIEGKVAATDPMSFVVDEGDHVRHPPGVVDDGFGVELGGNGVCMIEGMPPLGDLEPCPPIPERIPFQLVDFDASGTLTVTSDPDGRFWVMVGGHSGFEGFSAIYYTGVELTVVERR